MVEKDESEVKVNKWDGKSVKNAIEDAVMKICKEKYDYVERTRLMNGRLVISFVAVGIAMFGLLWDWLHPFPKSRPVLVFCVLSYFFLMGVLQLYLWYVEMGIFYVAEDRDPTGKRSPVTWRFASKMPKFDPNFELKVEMMADNFNGASAITKPVSEWIDENGALIFPDLWNDISKMHDSLTKERKTK